MFLSVARYEGLTLKINETKFDKKRSKSHPNIQPLSSKRTLSFSSRSKFYGDLSDNIANIPLIKIDSNDLKLDFKAPTISEELTKSPTSDTTLHISKSHSEGELGHQLTKTSSSTSSSRVDAFFKKTKSALINVGPKFRDVSSRESAEELTQKSKSQKSNENSVNLLELKNSFKKLPEFRNKLTSAFANQRTRRKINLTEEEIERRRNCKTKIIEL